jgi:hypothetical protein
MTAQERKDRIKAYGQGHALLTKALAEFPREMWQFKPGSDRWSIHEIIVHLADAEANSYVRCRCFIAEPGKTLMTYDQDLWANRLHYHAQKIEDALELFRWLRQTTYELIKSLPEDVWNNTVVHPEMGTYAFDRWLEIYEAHTRKHIEQMRRNYETWKQRG